MKPIELFKHQRELAPVAADILLRHGLVYLAFGMRVGKTLTALKVADLVGASRVLFVTPKSAIGGVKKQADGIGVPYELTVINYESLHKVQGPFDVVIPDEAHVMGQFPKPANRVNILKNLCKGALVIYASGTPHPESLSQLYHQFYVCDRSPWKEYKNFYKWAGTKESPNYINVKKIRFGPNEHNDYSNGIEFKIMGDVNHLFLRYTTEDAGFEQAYVSEQIVYCDMDPQIDRLAKIVLRDRYYKFKQDGEELTADTAVLLQQKLHQIYSGTIKTDSGKGKTLDTSKAEFIKQRYQGQRIAIFYKFVQERKLLMEKFAGEYTESSIEFNSGKKRVFLGQLKAASRGVDLHTADRQIFYNIDFSAETYEQARARLLNINRKTQAEVDYVFSRGGIEELIYAALQDKQSYSLNRFRRDYGIRAEASRQNHKVLA